MNDYLPFVDRSKEHLDAYKTMPYSDWVKIGVSLTNGLAAEELRRLVNIEQRREFGAFFTDSDLALRLVNSLIKGNTNDFVVYDPAVGAGNLLIAAIRGLAYSSNKISLLGTDLHLPFILAAKARLEIASILAKPDSRVNAHIECSVADGLVNNDFYKRATHIVTNPPFNMILAAKDIKWGKGKVSAAAIFIHRIIEFVNPRTSIIAILPDVLRSGSRYDKWRLMVEQSCVISNLEMLGQFDKFADVDVFSVLLIKKPTRVEITQRYNWVSNYNSAKTLSDLFDISVGNVVDNREDHSGPLNPFLVSRGLPGWQEINSVTRLRQFKGKSINGPFIVIKRTSRMGDKHRAIATIINIDSPVYVDNHLIVLKPKSGLLTDCRNLINKLSSANIDNWINDQIRCRHLTVKIVKKIPYDGV